MSQLLSKHCMNAFIFYQILFELILLKTGKSSPSFILEDTDQQSDETTHFGMDVLSFDSYTSRSQMVYINSKSSPLLDNKSSVRIQIQSLQDSEHEYDDLWNSQSTFVKLISVCVQYSYGKLISHINYSIPPELYTYLLNYIIYVLQERVFVLVSTYLSVNQVFNIECKCKPRSFKLHLNSHFGDYLVYHVNFIELDEIFHITVE